MTADERWMERALAEARRGRTAPNPHVGAAIVKDGELVAVGHHERAGEAHAEVNALRAAGERARGATLYCTLEPCNHHGRTPPCTDAILGAGVARVVIGCTDPAHHGETSGVARLRAAGVEVTIGVCEAAAREVIEDFACLVHLGRPLVVLKAAVTLDGRLATRSGDSKWITGEAARTEAHRLRDRADVRVRCRPPASRLGERALHPPLVGRHEPLLGIASASRGCPDRASAASGDAPSGMSRAISDMNSLRLVKER